MTREQAIRKREKLAARLSPAIGVLRGSLFERTIHHTSGCLKCARGEGHPLWVLTVGYPGGKTRQLSLRPAQVPKVREAIEQYHDCKQALEAISELNQFLLRLDREESKNQRASRDRYPPPTAKLRRWLPRRDGGGSLGTLDAPRGAGVGR